MPGLKQGLIVNINAPSTDDVNGVRVYSNYCGWGTAASREGCTGFAYNVQDGLYGTTTVAGVTNPQQPTYHAKF